MSAPISAAHTSPAQRDLLQRRFTAMVSRLGVTVERATALDAVAAMAAELAAAVPPDLRRVVLAPSLDAAYPALRQQLEARGATLTPIDVANPAATFGPAAVGISGASLGVAETGSYLIADALEDRLVRMLAHRHIVVLPVERLVTSLGRARGWVRDPFPGGGRAAPGRGATFAAGAQTAR